MISHNEFFWICVLLDYCVYCPLGLLLLPPLVLGVELCVVVEEHYHNTTVVIVITTVIVHHYDDDNCGDHVPQQHAQLHVSIRGVELCVVVEEHYHHTTVVIVITTVIVHHYDDDNCGDHVPQQHAQLHVSIRDLAPIFCRVPSSDLGHSGDFHHLPCFPSAKNDLLSADIVFQSYLSFFKFADGGDGREMAAKRQRTVDPGSSFYGASTGSNFMYNPSPYGYVSQPPPPPFPVVRLRGLPFDCTETDVAEFFHGLDIVDVLFVHKGGKFTGEGFCVLGYPLQVDFALQRNRQNMGRRYVEVFRSKRQEYYKAIANEVSDARGGSPRRSASRAKSYDEGKDSAEHTGVLRLRGLPFSASKDDIMEFFKDFGLPEDSIHIIMNSEGRPSGEAYAEFASAEDSKAAMVKDRMTLGSRYIELFPSSPGEMEEAISRGR
ncbi:Epithelial splicing regulatory protein 2 [Glycine soja]